MCKKIVSLLLTVLMLTSLSATAFAANYTDNVDVSATLQVITAGTPMAVSTPNTVSVSKTASEPFPAFDFRCILNMESVRAQFNEYYTNWISILNYAGTSDRIDELNAEMQNMQVTGAFTIDITYPSSVTIPAEFLVENQMVGFDDNAKLIFGNDTRTIIPGTDTNTLRITISIVGAEENGSRPGYVVARNLFTNVDTYLADFTLTLPNVGTTAYGAHTVSGKLTGTTVAEGDTTTLTISYQTNPEYATATATVTEQGTRPAPTTPVEKPIPENTITFYVDGNNDVVAPLTKETGTEIKIFDLAIPYRDGYAFDGWYTDRSLSQKLTGSFTLTKNVSLYGSFTKTTVPSKLNDEDHFAYIIGYPDGTVRPEALITREEVATIFFRLLTTEAREAIYSKTNSFTDMDAERWSNIAISTLVKGGILKGYHDGTFHPGAPITRAEFAAIASRIDALIEDAMHNFTDVSDHWANDYVANAVAKGWITGYEDGTFRPDQNITRAEAMTIANRMLKRFLTHDGYHADSIIWPDNPKDAWFHLAVIEATNGHNYDRGENNVHETWPSLRETPDWKTLEQ